MSDNGPGYERKRGTAPSVRRAETVSRVFITLGGLGTILAVLLIFGFLVAVVAPLFGTGHLESDTTPVALAGPGAAASTDAAAILQAGVDDLRLLAWTLRTDGRLEVHRLGDGSLVERRALFDGTAPTAWAFSSEDESAVFGFADGTIRSGSLGFKSAYFERGAAPAAARALRPGESTADPRGALLMTPEHQLRLQRLEVVLNEPQRIADEPITLVDLSGELTTGLRIATLTSEGALSISRERIVNDLMTGTTRRKVSTQTLPAVPSGAQPAYLLLDGTANGLMVLREDGTALRYDVRRGSPPSLAETLRLVPDNVRVTAATYLIGKTTLVVGDNEGVVRAWFPTKPTDAFAADGIEMRHAHTLVGPPRPVRAFGRSRRSRLLSVAYEGGALRVFQVTTALEVARGTSSDRLEPQALVLTPKEDGLVVFGRSRLEQRDFAPGHPEVTLASLFTPVWYEGAAEPAHVWQSEGGSDAFEPKLGLWPLVFGTLKATFYSMLFAAPIALLAAVFTSEFLSPRQRAPIKSVIEMMAGLPSVVLGFLAAIVIAPFVRGGLSTALTCLITVPLAFLLSARAWQFLPTAAAIRLQGAPRLLAIAGALALGVLMGALLGPLIESVCFGGDLIGWLDGGEGRASGAWAFFLFPIVALLVSIAFSFTVGPLVRRASTEWSRTMCAAADAARMLGGLLLALLLAWLLGRLLSAGGADPRGGVIGSYTTRNALVVGFVMGFAVIPIIYTLAEDALSSVPRHLREGSLGCGATRWQTAWRIVIPTAMSGVFSAMMVGLGRAVGETMIVLMAAGNTAILDLNVLTGFRTLSANLATELPEAVQGSTHYRTLFLAALVLFLMTFFINTVAELVRRVFRKRAAQL